MRLDEGTFNRLLECLPTRIGVPKFDGSRRDFVYDENAAFLFTGPFPLTAYRNGVPGQKETDQLTCRIQYVHFNRPPLPSASLNREFRPCPLCWARWTLLGEMEWQLRKRLAPDALMDAARRFASPKRVYPAVAPSLSSSGAPPATSASPYSGSSSTLVSDLRDLLRWHEGGLLSDAEFQRAKSLRGLS